VSIRFDAGEVLATSECTATTYWNDPEASRAAFERDASGRVWYRTGDLGYLDSYGNLHLTGRKTDLINRGGLKVAPWEVEEVLLRHPLVAEAVAFKVPDERLGEEVVAAVTLREGSVSEGDLRSFASRLLPVEKTPRRVFVVDAIPRNEMGKPLRAKLTERFSGLDRQVLGGKPEDELELGLIRICEDVLGIDGAGVNDNFFDLGGNSASAVEFLARVAKEYRFDAVTPAVLFEANSFALLAELLRRGDAAPQPVVALRAEGEGVPLVIVCVDPESYASPWRTLVRELPGDRPVYLLKPSLEGAETFAEMARVLVSSLQEVLPHGPYALAGTCLMAALAHEMTVQLEARGERVSAVFGIDTWFPYADRRLRAPGYFHPLRLAGVWREAGGLTGFLRRGALSMRNRLQLRPVRPIDEEIERAKAACRRHTATPIDARVVTIWSRHVEAITGHTPEQLWGGVAKHGLVIERFACDRFAMLAGAMNRELAELVEAHLRHPLALSVGACDSKPRSIEATAC
jgi:thioesterase domain-containing protein